jgi:hypothetical protein
MAHHAGRLRKQVGARISEIEWRECPCGGCNTCAWCHDRRVERVRCAEANTETGRLQMQPDTDRGTPAQCSEPTDSRTGGR